MAKPEDVKKKKLKSVSAQKAVAEEIYDRFTYPSLVSSQVQAVVKAENSGVIEKNNVRLGQWVKRGEVLAQIKHTDPVYQYKAVRVKAPVSGQISKVHKFEGSLVSKEENLFEIQDPKKPKAVIEVPAKDLRYIKAGNEGEVHLPYAEKPVKILIGGLSPVLDPATGTATAELEFIDGNGVLLGTIAKVTFKSNLHKGVQVPEHAISYDGNQPTLRLVRDGILKRVKVKLGETRQGKVEIKKGLKEGELVVLRASGFIPDGEKVEVQ